jgi:ribosomal protein L37AE/L43A
MVDQRPYELYDADLWKCPQCGIEVVGGFGHGPISAHYNENFQEQINFYNERGLLIKNGQS